MNPISKAFMGIKSVCIYSYYKVIYRKRIQLSVINSIRGGVHIELFRGASCSIGKFLMSRGPLYIKCTDGAAVKIGERCFFNNNCSITSAESVQIGDYCMFANNFVIVDHDHKIKDGAVTGELVAKPVCIGDNVWCGANVTILKGVTIGDGAVIAAGAVVNRDVEPHSVVGGIPARKIK